jgi:tRNA-splicing ligase RtcB
MPFVFPHVALMPDAHLGKGATVGSVIPTDRAIIPAAVGVDIGCGMIAVRTAFTADDLARGDLRTLREAIEAVVPVSAGVYNTSVTATAAARVAALEEAAEVDYTTFAGNWRLQLGTLGSVTISSRSASTRTAQCGCSCTRLRGVGNKIAQRHIGVAAKLCKQWWIDLPDPDLAYLVEGTDEFWTYMRDLRWAQKFALLNREEMMDRVIGALQTYLGTAVVERERINCHHNFTQRERHFGRDVWVSRKGAIEAKAGQPGLIPGSMGTASYVVAGKGDPVSLSSSPHGAGRQYSRTKARRTFTSRTCERQWSASNTATRTPSSTRSPRRTRTSTRSWPTQPTSSRFGTRYDKWSTSKATDSSPRLIGNGRGSAGHLRPGVDCRQPQSSAPMRSGQGAPSCSMGPSDKREGRCRAAMRSETVSERRGPGFLRAGRSGTRSSWISCARSAQRCSTVSASPRISSISTSPLALVSRG